MNRHVLQKKFDLHFRIYFQQYFYDNINKMDYQLIDLELKAKVKTLLWLEPAKSPLHSPC